MTTISAVVTNARAGSATAKRAPKGGEVRVRRRRRRALRAVAFCSAIGRALHETGTPASRLEARMTLLSRALGVPGQFSVNPTAFLAQYRLPGKVRPHAESVRVRPGGIDLALQADLEQLVDAVTREGVDLDEAGRRLQAVRKRAPAATWESILAVIVVSAGAAVFLGGDIPEVVVAAIAGVLVASLEVLAARRGTEERLVAPAAAFLVALLAAGCAQLVPGFSIATAQVASLIVLVPGLDFTLAIKEIATSHLVSGSARLVSAVGDFLLLGFGLAAGTQVATRILGAPEYFDPAALPTWVAVAAVVPASLAFASRFRAHLRHVPWIVLVTLVAWSGARLGTGLLGSDLGAFAGALAVGLVANGYARVSGGAATVLSLPGLIMLVPGSFGLRAMELVRRHDPLSGIENGFEMALVATALSTGLLLANLLLPSEPGPLSD